MVSKSRQFDNAEIGHLLERAGEQIVQRKRTQHLRAQATKCTYRTQRSRACMRKRASTDVVLGLSSRRVVQGVGGKSICAMHYRVTSAGLLRNGLTIQSDATKYVVFLSPVSIARFSARKSERPSIA